MSARKTVWYSVNTALGKYLPQERVDRSIICCGLILSLVQIFFSFVFGYGNV